MGKPSLERDQRSPPPAYSPRQSDSMSDEVQITTPLIEDTRSRLFRTLSKVAAHKDTSQKHEEHLSGGNRQSLANFNLRLNIVIQVVGSRGDVQPFVALGQELRRHGHRVRLATHGTFSDFVRKAGLEFYPIGGDPADLMAYMVKNPGLIPKMKTLREGEIQKKRKMVAEMLDGCWKSCIEPDPVSGRSFVAEAIIANPPSFAHIHCSQALGVPLHLMFTMPWTSTSAFPHPLANIKMGGSHSPAGIANYVSYSAVEFMTWQGLGDLVNSWRKTLGLEAVPSTEGPLLAETLRVPFTYCWSPALIPKPADWPPHVDVCGFFFRDPPKYEPPPEIASFLRAGPPPVYIGFGSIVIDDPAKLTATILQAVRETGVRAIISRGWSKLGGDLAKVDENVLFIGDCPHDWLFQHVAAVVHHGGAGTTACGLLNGRPTAIVPFFGDQPFWGAMVAAAGGGPRPIPQRQLNSDNLAEAIRFCLRPETAVAADSLGAQMRSESGVKAAVESFHAHLPVEELRCDILSNRAAAWTFKKRKTRVKLSKLAAEILTDNLRITWDALHRYDPITIVIDPTRWDPVTGTTSSLISTFKGMAVSASDIVIKPIQAYNRSSPRESNETLQPGVMHSRPATSAGEHSPSGEHNIQDGTAEIAQSTATARSHSPRRHGGHAALEAAAGSASGVGGVLKHFFKGMLVDMPLATTEGLRSMPKLYGGEVRETGKVTDWKSGAVVAGKNFHYGLVDGFTDLVQEPLKGKREEGALGAIKGVGKGSVNMVSKVSSGILGLVAYPGHGICKSISAAVHGTTSRAILQARVNEGRDLVLTEGTECETVVLRTFERLLSSRGAPGC
ncbi:hypothetical protein DL767_003993 [Monosporascus sp. MG133]|nr:hypothetical protein DL767_003993 [Monosporascus sp. MG133]